jgi:hypothetical protein
VRRLDGDRWNKRQGIRSPHGEVTFP